MKTRLIFVLSLNLVWASRGAVLPPDAIVEDKTIADWTLNWWQSFYPLCTNASPLFDPDGRWAHNGQTGDNVFFLGSGTGFETGPITRAFEVPEGKYLLVPVLIATGDNIVTEPPLTAEELCDGLASFMSDPPELHASIDGVPVPDLRQHRHKTPAFSVFFPDACNYATANYGHDIVGLVDPIVGDGYWLMVGPLPIGIHELNYGGTYPIFFQPTDITATITVVPAPVWELEQLQRELEEADTLPTAGAHSLGVSLQGARSSFEREQWKAGMNQLRAFQHKVRAQVAERDAELAEELWNKAEAIIERAEGEGW